MSLEALIFDVDGTLADTEEAHRQAFNVEALISAGFGASVLSWFEAVVTGDVVTRKKPAPDVYLRALASLNLQAAQAIALEDSAIGVRAAKAAGLFALATPSRWTRNEDFSGADLVLPSLAAPDRDAGSESRFGTGYVGLAFLAGVHATFVAPP